MSGDDGTPSQMQLHRDIGRLEGRFGGVEAQVTQVQATQDAMQEKIDAIHDAMMQAKGGWRMLFVVGSVSGAIGAFIASLWGMFRK